MATIRVFLTDDHTLFRKGIGTVLGAQPDMEIVGEASNGREAVEQIRERRPDVVLMDIGMPGLSSFEAARQINKLRPATKVMFLTMYDDEDYLMECMQVGGNGYMLKDSPAPQLLRAIREVHQGGSFLSPKMLTHLVDDFRGRTQGGSQRPRFSSLTPREKEILKYLAEGLSVKEVATQLNLSVKTIEAHKFNLMRKLSIHNKAELVHYAIRRKVIQVPMVSQPVG